MQELHDEGRVYYTRTGTAEYIRYLDEMPGVPLQDIWDDISPINSQAKERLGYPTQKPLALLERIVIASSNSEDVILDPFCGCGTAVAAAEKLDRKWIGIDITHLAISLIKYRMTDMFPESDFKVVGEPESLSAARFLALQHRFQFEGWAVSLVGAQPREKKGADKGIDGIITFIDDAKGKPKKIIIQVKSGKVGVSQVRDLKGTVEREKAAIGVFVSLEKPTKPMKKEAATSGFYHSPGWDKDYPRLQILTIEELLDGTEVKRPPSSVTFKRAKRVEKEDSEQIEMFKS